MRLLFFLCLLISVQLKAQRIWTLEQCVSTGLENNISLKQRELNRAAAEADYFQSRMGQLPSINGSATNNWNTGFAIDPVTNTTIRDKTFRSNNFGLNGSWVLFNGFQNTLNTRLQKNNTSASTQDLQSTKNNIALTICNAYLQTLLNLELLESRKLQLESTRLQLSKQDKLYELGGSSKSKLLQLRAQFTNEELQVVQAENNLNQSYLFLWQSMNILPDTANHIQKPDVKVLSIEDEKKTADEIFSVFVKNSPDVKAAELRSTSAEISSNIAMGGRSPRLILSGGINSFYTTQSQEITGYTTSLQNAGLLDQNGLPASPNLYYLKLNPTGVKTVSFSDQFDRNLGKSLGLTLSVPVFNGWQVNNSIKKADLNKLSAKLNEQQVRNDTYKSINQAYLDFKSAYKKHEANQNNLDANRESAALAEAQFNLGAIGTNDYLQTRNAYLQAETNYLQAKYELMFRRKVLDFYLGKSLY